MSEKRRDSKGRILRIGESQRKDGRYVYKYVDKLGKEQFVYAWKLVATDKTPAGKREDLSLREKEIQIQKDLLDGIVAQGGKITVIELVQKYTELKKNIKVSTMRNYELTINILKQGSFGLILIENVKSSDVKRWFIKLEEQGKKYGTIVLLRSIIKSAFEQAVADCLVRKNPFGFCLGGVIKNNTIPKHALTLEEEKLFLQFIKENNCYRKYYDDVIILLRTGVRISEFCGLTVGDLDFENKIINVEGQLIKDDKDNYRFTLPKSRNSIRKIPMTDEIHDSLKRVMEKRTAKNNRVVDGRTDFLFINRVGNLRGITEYELILHRIVKQYNLKGEEIKLPIITPHILRHTFCTRMASKGINPKALQYLMGHAKIDITLNVYTHFEYEDVVKEMERIENMKL
jgi:Site-specific recombinase XerD